MYNNYIIIKMIIIYGIKCNISHMLYIGSTKQNLKVRLIQHKSQSKNGKYKCMSKKIIKNNDYVIYEIEQCDENMRHKREQYWIDNTDNINNRGVIGRNLNKHSYSKDYTKKKVKNLRDYVKSWGGDKRCSNNLLLIDVNLFCICHI